jgi:hypothetical protein
MLLAWPHDSDARTTAEAIALLQAGDAGRE